MRVGVIVPFRDQLPLQNRSIQLQQFLPHMEHFLSTLGCQATIVVVEQSQDDRKFNRGQLLNVGFLLAKKFSELRFFITHDVDLLPSIDMRAAYTNPPSMGFAVHLASVWQKYTYGSFIGGVLGFRPEDFERVNGYPNNYWGWGLEDDQLALRMAHVGIRVLRVRHGSFRDMDPTNMKTVLESADRREVQRHLPWYNAAMFREGKLTIDDDWKQNGLSSLEFKVLEETSVGIVRHVVVSLGSQ